MKNYILTSLLIIVSFYMGCAKEDSATNPSNSDIPADPGGTAPSTVINNLIPSAQFSKTSGNPSRVKINLLGAIDPTTGTPFNIVANQNVYVSEDGTLKGLKVSSVGSGSTLAADVVFTIDNSGSMGEEADSIATKIIAFVNFLQTQGIDLRVGAVGYDGRVYGAINLTSGTALRNYLTRTFFTGTSRTVGFAGLDSAALSTAAINQNAGVSGENGIVAIGFADSLFTWRAGAQRVYINFTDESTQPNGRIYWSTEGLSARWNSTKGTIHTVWSGSDTATAYSWQRLVNERPWALSSFTGGTFKKVLSNARDLDLTTLPVTGALANSKLVEFITSNPNGTHTVVVTLKNGNTADGKQTYNITYP